MALPVRLVGLLAAVVALGLGFVRDEGLGGGWPDARWRRQSRGDRVRISGSNTRKRWRSKPTEEGKPRDEKILSVHGGGTEASERKTVLPRSFYLGRSQRRMDVSALIARRPSQRNSSVRASFRERIPVSERANSGANSGVRASFRGADDHDGAAHGRCRGDGK